MAGTTHDIAADLTALVGAHALITAPDAMADFVNEPRGRFKTLPSAVVVPRTVQDVQRVARWANGAGVALVPQGGNTGHVGGQSAKTGKEVIVALRGLDRVREVDPHGGHITVEAGVTLAHARRLADEADRLFPLYIASHERARIGGILSSNAGGVQVLSYGNARQLCLGVEAVLADGSLYNGLTALKKNNTGYDLSNLLIGAEGTLGFITAATLKLVARPAFHETALVSVDDPQAALELFHALSARAGTHLTAFELMPRVGFDLQLRHAMIAGDPTPAKASWYALIEISVPPGGTGGVLQQARGAARDVRAWRIAESPYERRAMWQAREQMSAVQKREGASIKHDISVPIAASPALITRGVAAVEALIPGVRPVPFGHIGDGNIHFNFSQPEDMDGAAFMEAEARINEAIYAIVHDLGGSVSAEHGIGQLKTGLLETLKDPTAMAMMRAIKQALDPNGILNPGKLLG